MYIIQEVGGGMLIRPQKDFAAAEIFQQLVNVASIQYVALHDFCE